MAPEVSFLPRIFNTPSRLICRNGWDESTTDKFCQTEFELLVLEGTDERGGFIVPKLGDGKSAVRQLEIRVSRHLQGIDQFSNVETLDISFVPTNGIDLTIFPRLNKLFLEWDKKRPCDVFRITSLLEMGLMGFPEKDCEKFSQLKILKTVGLTQCGVQSLAGLEGCKNLSGVSLNYLRKLTTLDALYEADKIQNISIEKLPALRGDIEVGAFKQASDVVIGDTPANANLSNIDQLRKLKRLWLGIPSMSLDWEQLFSIKALKSIALMNPKLPEGGDEGLIACAKNNRRKVLSLEWAGPRKRQIRLALE